VIVTATDENKLEYTLAAQHTEESIKPLVVSSVANKGHRGRSNSLAVPVPLEPIDSTQLLGTANEEDDDEEDPGIHMENLVPIAGMNSLASCQTILELSDADYHFVLNGRTWSLLEEIATPEELEQIVAKGTVYARMSPENKMQLVESLQGIGYVVGMCGDGANDCSALKMAHVGVSLSEAEASVAAPFTSKVPDISCVPNLIREGRCALVTSFAIFKYMALYSMVQFASVILLYTHETNLADTQFLYIDLGITTTIAVVMGRTEPYPKLVPQTPMGSLVSFANVFSIIVQVLISTTVQVGAMAYLTSQPWFVPVNPESPDDLVTLCWETTTIFSVSTFQYLILALVFSKGPPFRKPFWSNGIYYYDDFTLTMW
jgi:cation-transporting ATPase 13A2